MRKKGLPITQPVDTDSGKALLYPVDINEGPHICERIEDSFNLSLNKVIAYICCQQT